MPSRPKRTRFPSLLIIQADSEKLAADGLDLSEVARSVATLATLISLARSQVAKTSTFVSFQNLVRDAATRGNWDVVVIIGHSNAEGLRVASDRFLGWDDVGRELRPLKPRRVVLIACKGGRASGANALFRRLRALRRIYACPANCTKDLGKLMLGLVPAAVEKKAPRPESILYAQGLAALSVGGQLRHWMRDHDKDNPNGQLLDLVADLIDPHVRGLPQLVAALFS